MGRYRLIESLLAVVLATGFGLIVGTFDIIAGIGVGLVVAAAAFTTILVAYERGLSKTGR